jgi:hypothetical protein
MGAPKKMGHMTPGTPVSSVDDRRSVCRYAVAQSQAWLGWWEGQEFRSTAAQVVDISMRGCMMTVDQLPPPDQPVWFCPPGSTPVEWVEAKLVESKRRLLGPRVVRVAFRYLFSYENFKNVVYGPEAIREFSPPEWVPEEERDYW